MEQKVPRLVLAGTNSGCGKTTVTCAVLQALGLDGLADRHPMSLSGGQKQRVVVAAAMLSDKPLILLDEPTSGLDLGSMQQVGQLLQEWKAQGKTLLVITHDEELAANWCDRVIRWDDTEGV
jgi:energy-coupling factor transporter ATP-binding protein EcfA2